MMPVFASPLTSANALSMLWPSRAVCSRPWDQSMPACLAKASLNSSYWPRLSKASSKRAPPLSLPSNHGSHRRP